MKCPLCGSGNYKPSKHTKLAEIVALHEKGLSMRDIARALRIKSPSTVHYYLKQVQCSSCCGVIEESLWGADKDSPLCERCGYLAYK